MAAEVSELAVRVAGEDSATVATEEFDGGFGSGLGWAEHDGLGFG